MNPSQKSSDSIDEAFENRPDGHVLNLRVGGLVEVRSIEEILGTLDGDARLEALPFMPEMQKFCGHRFTVSRAGQQGVRRDRVQGPGTHEQCGAPRRLALRWSGSRGMPGEMLDVWKEAWLRRVKVPPGTDVRPGASSLS